MYATLYGKRTEVEPEETHFQRAPDGIWHLRKSSLPMNEILDAFERLDLKCVQLLFDSADQFWDTLEASNFNIIQAGLDPEALSSHDEFNQAFEAMKNPLERKLIYYNSVRHYSHVAQNIITHILISLGDAYALLSEPNLYENIPLHVQAYGDGERYRNTVSPSGHRIWTNVSFCIEKTVSFLDYTTKYVYELSHIKPGAAVPKKPKASSVLFQKWKDVKLANNTPLSAGSVEMSLIQALRNETVHNGTIDHFSKIYEHTSGSEIKRRFMLLPDHKNGRMLKAAGRTRFYHQDNHLNAVLPSVLGKVFRDTLSSLNKIDHRIENQWDDPNSYFKRHSKLSEAMKTAEDTGVFMKFSPTDQ